MRADGLSAEERREVWVMAQEVGAALDPIIERGGAPEWATKLSEAARAASKACGDDEDEEGGSTDGQ